MTHSHHIRSYPRKGRFDYGRYCGFWVSQWLTPKLTLREKSSAAMWAIEALVRRFKGRFL